MTDTIIVIGSGPCGAVAAADLVARGEHVTLVDAGATAPRGALVRVGGRTVFRWIDRPVQTGRHIADADSSPVYESSLTLGGLSNYWTSAVPRFDPRDFDEGAVLDERYRWPLTYEELAPYYDVVEDRMDITSGAAIETVPLGRSRYVASLPRAWRDLMGLAGMHGFPMGALPMAQGAPTMANLRPTGWNSWHCLIKPILGDPHLTVVAGARVLRIGYDASTGRADSVEYLDVATGERRHLACRAVVVAAGALDSTRILLQSRSREFPRGLGNTEDLVGRYAHDHPRQWFPVALDRAMPMLSHPAYVARAPHGSGPTLMAASHTIGLPSSWSRAGTWVGARSRRIGVQVFGTMVPQPEHRVSVEPDEDPVREATSPVRIDVSYDQQALDNMVGARERLVDALGAGGVSARPEPPFHPPIPGSSVHYAGTVRMHADRRLGVLDRWNRIHDVPNVAVVDLSCFTTNPEKNPTLTAMALAVRAVRRLADDLR